MRGHTVILGLAISPRLSHISYAARHGLNVDELTYVERREAFCEAAITEARARARSCSAASIQGAPMEAGPMASFTVEIQTPKVPETLTVKLPTQTKGSPMKLHRFTKEQVAEVAADWGKRLIEAYGQAVEDEASKPDEPDPDEGVPDEPEKKKAPPKGRSKKPSSDA